MEMFTSRRHGRGSRKMLLDDRAGPIPPWTDPIQITILASRYDTYHDTFIYRRLVVKMNRFIPRTAQKGK